MGPECSPPLSDVEAFAKAMQNGASPEPKEAEEGKDKKDDEEDMSLD